MVARSLARSCALMLLAAPFASAPLDAQGAHAGGPPAGAEGDAATGPRAAPEWRWSGAVPRGGVLVIELIRGTIRLERASASEVAVIARRSATTSDPLAVAIRVDTTGSRLAFVATYPPLPPRSASNGHDCLPPDDGRGDFWRSDVRVELLVRVPDGARVRARVVSGDIDVAPIAAELELTTNTGTVRIADPEGSVLASTGSGDVELRLASPASRRAHAPIRLQAYDGAIRVVGMERAPPTLRWTDAPNDVAVSGRLAPDGREVSARALHGTVRWVSGRD